MIKYAGVAYCIVNGAITCKVGYISYILYFSEQLDDVDGQYALVVELYALSSNTYKVMKDSNNYGMAACEVIDQVASNYS